VVRQISSPKIGDQSLGRILLSLRGSAGFSDDLRNTALRVESVLNPPYLDFAVQVWMRSLSASKRK